VSCALAAFFPRNRRSPNRVEGPPETISYDPIRKLGETAHMSPTIFGSYDFRQRGVTVFGQRGPA